MNREKNYDPGLVITPPQGRNEIAAASTLQPSSPLGMVTDGAARGGEADRRRKRAPGEHRKSAITMRLTLLPPSGRRTRWWALGRCPVCGVPHLSRSRELDQVTRTRRLPCGHWVQPVVARSLSPYPETRAA